MIADGSTEEPENFTKTKIPVNGKWIPKTDRKISFVEYESFALFRVWVLESVVSVMLQGFHLHEIPTKLSELRFLKTENNNNAYLI